MHRLVLDAFVGVDTRKRRITWVDGDKSNNSLTNLRLVTSCCRKCGVELTAENADVRKDQRTPRGICKACGLGGARARRARRIERDAVCEICGGPETVTRGGRVRALTQDHNHATGALRGFLCSRHNTGIGMFGDDPALLRAAADYLDRYATDRVA